MTITGYDSGKKRMTHGRHLSVGTPEQVVVGESGPTWTGKRGVRAGGHIPDRGEAEQIGERIRGILGLR